MKNRGLSFWIGFWTLAFLVFFVSDKTWADESSGCSSYEAIYVPRIVRQAGEEIRYELRIESENLEAIYPGGVTSYFLIYAYDGDSDRLLSVARLPYGCTGGGAVSCQVRIKQAPLSVLGLSEGFVSQAPVSEKASYALVFPEIENRFYYMQNDPEQKVIQHFTPERIRFTPQAVWMLRGCEQGKDVE